MRNFHASFREGAHAAGHHLCSQGQSLMFARLASITLLSALLLQGCTTPFTSTTADDIRNGGGRRTSFTVHVPFDEVVNNEFYISDNCYIELVGGGVVSRHFLNQASHEATILNGYGGHVFASHVSEVIDIFARGHGETEIHIYEQERLIQSDLPQKVKNWALGSRKC